MSAVRRQIGPVVLLLAWAWANAAPAAGGPQTDEVRAAQALVDLARDFALERAGRQSDADVEQLRVLLEAAVRLDPRQREAQAWLYEFAVLRGDAAAAAGHMDALWRAAPDSEQIFRRWLESGLLQRQTLEQRREWLGSLFGEVRGPRDLALIHTVLADMALQQADPGTAQRHLIEARESCPECPEIAQTALHLLTPETSPEGRLEALLAALRANPLDGERAWLVGSALDELGFFEEALQFHAHGRALWQRFNGTVPIPPMQLIALGINALARGDVAGALELARQATDKFSGSYAPLMFLAEQQRDSGNRVASDQIVQELQRAFEGVKDPGSLPPGVAAEIAWFYCVLDVQPEKAMAFAERGATAGRFGERVYGWALALTGRLDEAAAQLAPLARSDPEATYQLVLVRRKQGDEAGAERAMAELDAAPPAGPTRQRLESLALPSPALRLGAQHHPEAAAMIAGFDRRVLEFAITPEKFLGASMRAIDLGPRPGEPWPVEFSLINNGPFPIPLGAGEAVNPVFLVSVALEGDRPREFPLLLTVELDAQRVLMPGRTLSVVRRVDVGPVATVNRRTPQQLQRAKVTAMLDPVQRPDGSWVAALEGVAVAPLSFNRLPANVTDEAWRARLANLTGDDAEARFLAIRELAELLAESQRAGLDKLGYRAEPIPAERVRRALLAALKVRDPWVRAAALEALADAGFDADLLGAIEENARHESWVVRLLAVRLLGERKVASAAGLLAELSRNDADELVKRMCAVYTGDAAPTSGQAVVPASAE